MVSLKSLLLHTITALAATVPLSTRAASPEAELILSDLISLDNSVLALKATIQNYTTGILPATPILFAISNVNTANRKCYLDSMLIGNQTVADSFTLVDYVRDTLAYDIPDTVKVLEGKKKQFKESGLDGAVVGSLELLKYDHESFSAALESKIAEEAKKEADYVVKVIDDSLTEGIAEFSS
jgi:hypothetical protein